MLYKENGQTARLLRTIMWKLFLCGKKVRIWKVAFGTHLKVLPGIFVDIISKP